MNTSFVAIGQQHDDGKALEAVLENLKTLHKELKQQGGALVMANERAPGEELTSESSIKERRKEGLVYTYLDQMKAKGEPPTAEDFAEKHLEASVNRSYENLSSMRKGEQKRLRAGEKAELTASYHALAPKAEWANNQGMGPTRLMEAEIYDYARKNHIKVAGLDPISNKEKAELAGEKGDMSLEVMENMEFHRTTGMAVNASKLMSELADKQGGCVLAINMGPAHFGSLELALHEANQQNAKLKDAPVKMCTLMTGTKDEAQKRADQILTMSPEEMLRAHARAVPEVAECEKDVTDAQLKVKEMNAVMQKFNALDERKLIALADDPAMFHAQLWADTTHEDLKVELETIENTLAGAEKRFSSGKQPTFTKALVEQGLCPNQSELQEAIDDLKECHESLEAAEENLATRVGQDEFANRVLQRLESKPPGVFVVGESEGGGYTKAVQTTLQDATGHHKQTVDEALHSNTSTRKLLRPNLASRTATTGEAVDGVAPLMPITTRSGSERTPRPDSLTARARTQTTRERMLGKTAEGGESPTSVEEKVDNESTRRLAAPRTRVVNTRTAAHIDKPETEAPTTGDATKVKTQRVRNIPKGWGGP